MVSALAAGNNIVVDATHAQVSWRRRLMQQDLGVGRLKWIGWWLQTPLDQCLAWNRSRQRQVPEHVIRAMHRILTTPQGQPAKSEGFTNLIRLDYAGPDLNDQINLALRSSTAMKKGEQVMQPSGTAINVFPTAAMP